jgi:hypothetical protein
MQTSNKQRFSHGYQPLDNQNDAPWYGHQHPSALDHDTTAYYTTDHSYDNKQLPVEAIPLRNPYVPRDAQPSKDYEKLSRRCRCDLAALTLCILIWLLIAASIYGFVLNNKARRNTEGWVDGATIANGFAYLLGLSAIAITLNEALIDRAWRRIKFQALRGSVSGNHLRAANFQLLDTLKRLMGRKLSMREFATFVSYSLLRWGTMLSFATLQLTVHIRHNDNNPNLFFTQMRMAWIPVPLVAHIFSLFGALAVSGLPPWSLLLNKFDEKVMEAAYARYLDIVPYGSAATSEQVAALLDKSLHPQDFSSLTVDHTPGLQAGKKLRGTLSGTLIMIGVPLILFLYQHEADEHGFAIARFAYSLGLSTIATGYTFSQNFAVWTLGLEGITSKPRSDTNRLGTTSGVMLFVKACRQRRPVRAFVLYWMFWSHALIFRFLIFTYTWLLTINKIVPDEVKHDVDHIRSLAKIFWPVTVWILVLPPFAMWFFVPFKAPLMPIDGWRIAKILEGATKGKGRYGIEGASGQGMAKWSMNTRVFTKEKLL